MTESAGRAFKQALGRCVVKINSVPVGEHEFDVAKGVADAGALAKPERHVTGINLGPVYRTGIDNLSATFGEQFKIPVGEIIRVIAQSWKHFFGRNRPRHVPIRIDDDMFDLVGKNRGLVIWQPDNNTGREGNFAIADNIYPEAGHIHHDVKITPVARQPAPAFQIGKNLINPVDHGHIQLVQSCRANDAIGIKAVFCLIPAHSFYHFAVIEGYFPGVGDNRWRHRDIEALLQRNDAVVAHATSLQVVIGALHGCTGWLLAPWIAQLLGLQGAVAGAAVEYLRMGFLLTIPMGLAALIDNVFFGIGDTRTPLLLQLLAVGLNFLLNPIFIYGVAPWDGLELLREGVSEPWLGIGGAALATGLSRLAAVSLGLLLLWRRHRVRWWPTGALVASRLRSIVSLGMPAAISVAIYAGVYFGILRLVFEPLPTSVLAGFGLGFNAFEGVAFPFYLGLSVAGASLVGRCLGAQDPAAISAAIRSVRAIGLSMGLVFGAIFMFLGPLIVPLFTRDPAVQAVSIQYVQVLALSQVFVALEVLSEKVLMGLGITRPALWISVPARGAHFQLLAEVRSTPPIVCVEQVCTNA